jgi:low affinity Fe/Cu permease
MDFIKRTLTQLGVLAAHPLAFLLAIAYGVLWHVFEPQTFGWHGMAVLGTLLIALLIQRAEHRDTQAIHAKLDALLHAQAAAGDAIMHIDEREPEDIEHHRAQAHPK